MLEHLILNFLIKNKINKNSPLSSCCGFVPAFGYFESARAFCFLYNVDQVTLWQNGSSSVVDRIWNVFMNYRDSDLARKIGSATALEVRASGAQYTFAPCVAVRETFHKQPSYSCPYF